MVMKYILHKDVCMVLCVSLKTLSFTDWCTIAGTLIGGVSLLYAYHINRNTASIQEALKAGEKRIRQDRFSKKNCTNWLHQLEDLDKSFTIPTDGASRQADLAHFDAVLSELYQWLPDEYNAKDLIVSLRSQAKTGPFSYSAISTNLHDIISILKEVQLANE